MPSNIISRSSLSCQCVFALQLLLYELVEIRARQGIGDADADIVRPGGFDQLSRRQDVVQLFTKVAELNEESDTDACGFEPLARRQELRDRVPLFIASSTRWLPLSAPIQASRNPHPPVRAPSLR